jgi:hypothetical protein
MRKRKRLRRPDPARTAPIRKFSTMLRAEGERGAAPGDAQPQRGDDAAAQAVRMGYSVVEEQIRRGRLAAQQMTGGAGGIGMSAGEPGPMINRLLRYSTDLMTLYFDLAGMFAQPSMLNRMGAGKPGAADPGGSHPAQAGSGRGTRLVIEITSKRKSQVTVDLWANASNAKLAVPALHSLDAEKPPIKDITFVPGANGEPPRLRIAIPASLGADVYTGLIVDAESRESTGTLSVRLFD